MFDRLDLATAFVGILRVGPSSVVLVAGCWVVGSSRLLAGSGVGACNSMAVVLEIANSAPLVAAVRGTNNNNNDNDMAGKDVGFIFGKFPGRGLIQDDVRYVGEKAECDLFVKSWNLFFMMEISICVGRVGAYPRIFIKDQ